MQRLRLRKETLTELTAGELAGVAGGSYPSKYDCTVSYQVCNPLSEDACVVSLRACLPTFRDCIPTQGC